MSVDTYRFEVPVPRASGDCTARTSWFWVSVLQSLDKFRASATMTSHLFLYGLDWRLSRMWRIDFNELLWLFIHQVPKLIITWNPTYRIHSSWIFFMDFKDHNSTVSSCASTLCHFDSLDSNSRESASNPAYISTASDIIDTPPSRWICRYLYSILDSRRLVACHCMIRSPSIARST